MSFERLSEILSEATPAAGWIDGQPTRYSGSEVHRMVWDAKIASLAPDAIALLADFGDAVRKQTDEYDEAEVRRSWPDAPILAIFDLLTRLDALCGDAHA